MTRKEEIQQASVDYTMSTKPKTIGGDAFADMIYKSNINPSFIAGAEWADRTIIDKACDWLKENVTYIHPRKGTKECAVNLEAFRKAMEE